MTNTEKAICAAYQSACWEHLNAAQQGRKQDQERFFAAANAIEDAWPELIAAYTRHLRDNSSTVSG